MTVCKACGAPVAPAQTYCSACGVRLGHPAAVVYFPDPVRTAPGRAGLRFVVILLLVFVYPLGIPIMWATRAFAKRTMTIVTLAFAIAALLGFIMIILWTSSPGYLY